MAAVPIASHQIKKKDRKKEEIRRGKKGAEMLYCLIKL
jgi:hypothetical protein